MALRKNSTVAAPASPEAAKVSPAPAAAQTPTNTSAAPSAASASSSPAAASPATGTSIPATQSRDLAAMRARLAGGQTGGVNSPEGVEKITEALVAPRTQETASGGAEPIPAAPSADPAPAAANPDSTLTRGQKAAQTRAKNRASAASTPAAQTPVSAAGITDPVADAAPLSCLPVSDLTRIADALERIAAWADVWGGRL